MKAISRKSNIRNKRYKSKFSLIDLPTLLIGYKGRQQLHLHGDFHVMAQFSHWWTANNWY
jgi:hypothetical protein